MTSWIGSAFRITKLQKKLSQKQSSCLWFEAQRRSWRDYYDAVRSWVVQNIAKIVHTTHALLCFLVLWVSRWRHQMEAFSVFLAICEWNHRSPINASNEGQWRGALMFSFGQRLNKRLSKQSRHRWFKTQSRSLWRHCNVTALDQGMNRWGSMNSTTPWENWIKTKRNTVRCPL